MRREYSVRRMLVIAALSFIAGVSFAKIGTWYGFISPITH